MSNDATQQFIAQTGKLYRAEVGTDFPSSISDPVDTGDWTELGLVDTDGVDFSLPANLQFTRSWQELRPGRAYKGDQDWVIGANLQQWNTDTVLLAFGGGEVDEVVPGDFRWTPPAASDNYESAVMFEAQDGDVTVRWGFPRVVNQAAAAFKWSRSGESRLPLQFMVLSNNDDDIIGGADAFLDSDAVAFTPSGS